MIVKQGEDGESPSQKDYKIFSGACRLVATYLTKIYLTLKINYVKYYK